MSSPVEALDRQIEQVEALITKNSEIANKHRELFKRADAEALRLEEISLKLRQVRLLMTHPFPGQDASE
jgi:hypothetical protein